jgi:hypothetical protein
MRRCFLKGTEMSLQTWKDEFYPVRAKDCPIEDAIDHSIRKWEGMRQENIDKHGIKLVSGVLESVPFDMKEVLYINASTCALCHYYAKEGPYGCAACPITAYKKSRDESVTGDPCGNAYMWGIGRRLLVPHRDPTVMIELLKNTKEHMESTAEEVDHLLEILHRSEEEQDIAADTE